MQFPYGLSMIRRDYFYVDNLVAAIHDLIRSARPSYFRSFLHTKRRAASRVYSTAGRNNAIRIALTTSSSVSLRVLSLRRDHLVFRFTGNNYVILAEKEPFIKLYSSEVPRSGLLRRLFE